MMFLVRYPMESLSLNSFVLLEHLAMLLTSTLAINILTHSSNAKCFRNATFINIRGLAKIVLSFRGYGRHSPNKVMIKREYLTDEVLLLFS